MSDSFAKDTDGFLARHFDRKISGAISRQLLKTPITPNQITIAVTGLGVFSGFCMAEPGYGPKVLGAFLFLVTSILDGCDGEIARAKKMTSKLGGWLDLWGDNVVHIAVFYGLGVGLYKDTGLEMYTILGSLAALGTLISAFLASYQTYKKLKQASPPSPLPMGEGEPSKTVVEASLFTSVVGDASKVQTPWQVRLVRWSDALARRDFIYGVVVLALINKLEWFLWACSIGVNIYALVLVALLIITPE
jgi:phosphatidylglycerophosphate synthase